MKKEQILHQLIHVHVHYITFTYSKDNKRFVFDDEKVLNSIGDQVSLSELMLRTIHSVQQHEKLFISNRMK